MVDSSRSGPLLVLLQIIQQLLVAPLTAFNSSFFGGSALLLFYSEGALASCNYIPQIMLNNAF